MFQCCIHNQENVDSNLRNLTLRTLWNTSSTYVTAKHICMIHIGNIRPFQGYFENNNELGIEFIITLITTLMFMYTQFLTDPYVKF